MFPAVWVRVGQSLGLLLLGLGLTFPLWMPLQVPVWTAELGSDTVLHGLWSVGCGLALALAAKLLGWRIRYILPGVVLLLGGAEIAQAWMPLRSYDPVELAINAWGGAFGASFAGIALRLLLRAVRLRLAADLELLRRSTAA